MNLVEQQLIKKSDRRYGELDALCFASKNLYNQANYHYRQAFFAGKRLPTYNRQARELKSEEVFKVVGSSAAAQQILRQVAHDWDAFFKAKAAYEVHPEDFTGKPKPPKYKDKQLGRNVLTYTMNAISKLALREGIIRY